MKKEAHIAEHEPFTEEARHNDATVVFGFWMYLMTDFVLFASLFAVFLVLRSAAFDGVSGTQLFSLPYALIETLVLLTSSFVCGLTLLAARAGSLRRVLLGLCTAGLLGVVFLVMELSEFGRLIASGQGPEQNGFFSAYFTLVGTHGLHIALGLVWLIALMISLYMRGLSRSSMRKLMLWSLFWHFLDIIWIFIFTIVYLMGAA